MESTAPSPSDLAARRTLRYFLLALFLLPIVAVVLVLLSTLFGWELPIGNRTGEPTPQEETGRY